RTRRTWGADLCTLDGDGNVCWRKLLMPKDQIAASKKCPHTAKPHAKQSQRTSRLLGRFLQPADTKQNCGRASVSPPMTKLEKQRLDWTVTSGPVSAPVPGSGPEVASTTVHVHWKDRAERPPARMA